MQINNTQKYLMNATKKMIKDYNKQVKPDLWIHVYKESGCYTVMFPQSKTRTFLWIPFEKIDAERALEIFFNIAEKTEKWLAEENLNINDEISKTFVEISKKYER